jgi:RHS repeat-associated protein
VTSAGDRDKSPLPVISRPAGGIIQALSGVPSRKVAVNDITADGCLSSSRLWTLFMTGEEAGANNYRQVPDGEDADNGHLRPAVTLPRGGGALRGIDEKFAVVPATGTATISVPIYATPGRSEFHPQLSLTYDSGAGNGPFGLGWRLSTTAITRKTSHGVPRYEDAWDSDTFVLEGAEDLVPAHLEDGRVDERHEGDHTVRRYRPRIEGAFARIEQWQHNETGDLHWRTISKENITTIYGRNLSCRIADPDDVRRIFTWLVEESFDDRGNIITYQYITEDMRNVTKPIRHSGSHIYADAPDAQRYLKRIRYANAVPFVRADWRLELVFDYGDHSQTAPAPSPDRDWPCRPDCFSTYRSGFEIRTRRICSRVLVFHHFASLGAQPVLVRSTDITHELNPLASLLTEVTQTGYEPTADGHGFETRTLPPLEFGYTRARWDDRVQIVSPDRLENLPTGLSSPIEWVDLHGEGLTGALTRVNHTWLYKRNLGNAIFGGIEPESTVPSLAERTDAREQFLDLDGSGLKSLILLRDHLSGYFKRSDPDNWGNFVPFQSRAELDWTNANVRLADVTGDGIADVLVTEAGYFDFYESLGTRGFAPPVRIPQANDEERGPRLVFADMTRSIFLADMTGDGLVDIVRIRNGDIAYWPSLGYGRFGGKVQMDGAPWFDSADLFDPARIRLSDVDGTGPTDLLYIGDRSVSLWRNLAGNGFDTPRVVAEFPTTDQTAAVSIVDLFGNGLPAIVWSSMLPNAAGSQLRYVDVLGGNKPHLLESIDNNLGLEIRLRYAPSTRFYLAARTEGRPWVTTLPFPVHVLDRVASTDAVTGVRLVSEYSYSNGYFDPYEREFRGFAYVEQRDAETLGSDPGVAPSAGPAEPALIQPPVVRKKWFDTGAYEVRPALAAALRRDAYSGDPGAVPLAATVLPAETTAIAAREAARSLKGLTVREEVFAFDGSPMADTPYVVVEHSYHVRVIQPPKTGRHAVVYSHPRETITYHYERDHTDPRAEHELILSVDPFGYVTSSARVAYPRRIPAFPEQGTARILYSEFEYSHITGSASVYRLGLPRESRAYELTGVSPAGVRFDVPELRTAAAGAAAEAFEADPSPAPSRRLVEATRTIYYKDDLSGPLPLGDTGIRGLIYEHYAAAFTPGLVKSIFNDWIGEKELAAAGYIFSDSIWWLPSGRQVLDPAHFYLPTQYLDPFGQAQTTRYDSDSLLPEQIVDPLGNSVSMVNDYRHLRPVQVTDPNGNRSSVRLDALGLVVAAAVMGKEGEPDPQNRGDTLADPTIKYEYRLDEYRTRRRPVSVRITSREEHASPGARWHEMIQYFDGSRRIVMEKVKAEPGLAPARGPDGALQRDTQGRLVNADTSPAPRWVGTGRTVFDNKGNPVKRYEPFFSSTPEYEDERDLVEFGVTPVLHYDPLGRMVRTDHPNGTFSRSVLSPWSRADWDEDDTVLESRWYAERSTRPAADPERRAADQAARHAGTPRLTHTDVLGHAFLAVLDNSGERLATRSASDIKGNVTRIVDARGNTIVRQSFGMLSQRLLLASLDGGERRQLANAADHPLYHWDSRGHVVRHVYDQLQRQTHLYVRTRDGPEILAERTIYGEDQPDAAARNLRTRVCQVYDGAGLFSRERYDFKGNLVRSSRRLAVGFRTQPDWQPLAELVDPDALTAAAAPLLEDESFEQRRRFDALDRVTSIVTPDGSEALPIYNEANLLESLSVRLRGDAAATPFVRKVSYDAKGQRELIAYGSDVISRYVYDSEMPRLVGLRTTQFHDTAVLQDLGYTYDPVGNITEIRDGAQQTRFFDNAVVSADQRLEYDDLYRLVSATGRELAAWQQPTPNDVPVQALPLANDGQAVRRYTEHYQYDQAGNLKSVRHEVPRGSWACSYDYAPTSNRLRAATHPGDVPGLLNARYSYDEHGNTTRMPHLADLSWDYRDRLVGVDLSGGGRVWYIYDGAGRRTRKVIERAGAVAEETIYLANFEIFRTYGPPGDIRKQRETLHVYDDHRRIAVVEIITHDSTGTAPADAFVRYQLANHLGSAALEVDASGALITYEEYLPYGGTSYRAARADVQVSPKRYRFLGRERDEETGMNFHGGRYLAPWLGRWISFDPLEIAQTGASGDLGGYAYANNNPIVLVDPNGQFPWGKVLGIGAAIVVGVGLTILTGGAAAAVLGPVAGAIFTGAATGAIAGLAGEFVESKIEGREPHYLRSALIGMAGGALFAGAGQAISAGLRTVAGKALMAEALESSLGQQVARVAYAVSRSVIGKAYRAVANAFAPIESASAETGEALGDAMGGRFAQNAARSRAARAAIDGVTDDVAGHSGVGVRAAQRGTINGEPVNETAQSGSRRVADRMINTPEGPVPAPTDDEIAAAGLKNHPTPRAGGGPPIPRLRDAEIRLLGRTVIRTNPDAAGTLYMGASAPMCPSCTANVWRTMALRPGIDIYSAAPDIPFSGGAGATVPVLVPSNPDLPPAPPPAINIVIPLE